MVSDWVKTTRMQLGWSQAELARRAGVTRLTITLLEDHQDAAPGVLTLSKLAQAFNVSVETLRQAAVPEEATAVTGSRLDDWVLALAAIGADLTPMERRAVIEYARSLRSRQSPHA